MKSKNNRLLYHNVQPYQYTLPQTYTPPQVPAGPHGNTEMRIFVSICRWSESTILLIETHADFPQPTPTPSLPNTRTSRVRIPSPDTLTSRVRVLDSYGKHLYVYNQYEIHRLVDDNCRILIESLINPITYT